MKFGVREICDVVLKAKSNQWVGNKYFYKDEPVIYFDTLKTSSMEGAATTVYAQGGRGNSRLVAWEGERTVTFTMEDALISPEGFMILSGAGLTEASASQKVYVHTTETTNTVSYGTNKAEIYVKQKPYSDGAEHYIYIMPLDENGDILTEPYACNITVNGNAEADKTYKITLNYDGRNNDLIDQEKTKAFLVDYYVEKTSDAIAIDITPDKFGGFYYLEASTLFRDANTGKDMPAEFIIPKCKIQSNFTFTMASSGDPSTFTFTIDAFPDYTRFNKTQKVFAEIQVISDIFGTGEYKRRRTVHGANDMSDEDKMNDPTAISTRKTSRAEIKYIVNNYTEDAFEVIEDEKGTYSVTGLREFVSTGEHPDVAPVVRIKSSETFSINGTSNITDKDADGYYYVDINMYNTTITSNENKIIKLTYVDEENSSVDYVDSCVIYYTAYTSG